MGLRPRDRPEYGVSRSLFLYLVALTRCYWFSEGEGGIPWLPVNVPARDSYFDPQGGRRDGWKRKVVRSAEYGLRGRMGGAREGADDAVNVALLASQRTHISRFANSVAAEFLKSSAAYGRRRRPGATRAKARETCSGDC